MYRIGYGNDIHRLEAGRKLIIGGVTIEASVGAVGHSDADVLTHAVTDALLGALALGDIGSHFSDKDERWKDADSITFLSHAVQLVSERGYSIVNIDSTVSLEQPKLRPFIPQMAAKLAAASGIEIGGVSIKAKTGEGLDAVGEGRAIRAEAVVLLEKRS